MGVDVRGEGLGWVTWRGRAGLYASGSSSSSAGSAALADPQPEPPCARAAAAAFAACQLAVAAAAACQRRAWTTGRRAVGLRPLRVAARWRRVEAAGLQQRRALGWALAAVVFRCERRACGVERALALATSLATPPREWRSVVVVGIVARV